MKTYERVEVQLHGFLASALHAEDPVLKTNRLSQPALFQHLKAPPYFSRIKQI